MSRSTTLHSAAALATIGAFVIALLQCGDGSKPDMGLRRVLVEVPDRQMAPDEFEFLDPTGESHAPNSDGVMLVPLRLDGAALIPRHRPTGRRYASVILRLGDRLKMPRLVIR